MRGIVQLASPKDLEFIITLRLTLDELNELKNHLSDNKWPDWELGKILLAGINKARTTIDLKDEVNP